eukprot:14623045-Ditylum_brightwellii.AAC.1
MPRLKQSSSTIAFRHKYAFRKWRPPSSHYKATKKVFYFQTEGNKIEIDVPSDVVFSPPVTEDDQMKNIITK